MILLRKPEPYSIRRFLDDQVCVPLNYPDAGATKHGFPAGYAVNHIRTQVGFGQQIFDSACAEMESWQQLQLGWVYSWPENAPLRVGENIAIIGRAFGLWWMNACRIIYTETPSEEICRFGYAVGTLQDHLLQGEERYVIEMKSDETVWVEIAAFSRPNKMAAKLGYPMMRRAQRRFGRDSTAKLLHRIEARQSRCLASARSSRRVVASL